MRMLGLRVVAGAIEEEGRGRLGSNLGFKVFEKNAGRVMIRVGFKTHESNPISSGLTHSGQPNPA
jgi:hypothetical protein